MTSDSESVFKTSFASFRIALRNLLGKHGVATNPCSTEQEILGGLEGLLKRRQTELDEEHLIYITEILTLSHLGMRFNLSSSVANFVCAKGCAEMTEEALRRLLRESLRDPRFRQKFNDHFSSHPLQIIREAGWEWLCEVLVWES